VCVPHAASADHMLAKNVLMLLSLCFETPTQKSKLRDSVVRCM